MSAVAEIGVFGGSGFYSLLDNVTEVKVDTPYGPPSDSVFVAEVDGRRVAFLPRHGRKHTLPPHKIPYRANVWAFHKLGVKAVVSPCAVGSLQREIAPGDFLLADQFVDRTNGRADTFYDGPVTAHVSPADMYDRTLRKIAVETIRKHGITCHDGGTVVVIQGPRFSTKAESIWFTKMGWHVVNMTQYPEAYLCHELGMGVVNISLVTDYDSGVVADTEAVTAHNVLEVFQANAEKARNVVLDLIGQIPRDLSSIGSRDSLALTRGDGHTTSPWDVRIFES
ncbi:MAG: S-methyl-5'-thioadenosine phosphorylase [Fimbriimonadaceae bacterium]|nr:S-methyl-5'-thioadenosine phosphorylase [Fimbriimonadaceae bacterium]QYK55738.1 MAG: S-methyl-5'-thioadenosine phosphorylase [Fimbriimonadaceae bacterium]